MDLHNNTLSPIHSGFDIFTNDNLGKHNIRWYTKLDFSTTLDSEDTTESIASREQLSDRFDHTLPQKSEKSSENQEKLRFSISPEEKAENFKNWFADSKVVDENEIIEFFTTTLGIVILGNL